LLVALRDLLKNLHRPPVRRLCLVILAQLLVGASEGDEEMRDVRALRAVVLLEDIQRPAAERDGIMVARPGEMLPGFLEEETGFVGRFARGLLARGQVICSRGIFGGRGILLSHGFSPGCRGGRIARPMPTLRVEDGERRSKLASGSV